MVFYGIQLFEIIYVTAVALVLVTFRSAWEAAVHGRSDEQEIKEECMI